MTKRLTNRNNTSNERVLLGNLARSLRRGELREVVIPASVHAIPPRFCQSNHVLRKLQFAEGSVLEEIGESAFAECDNLEIVEFPPSLRRVCDEAFKNTPVEKLDFPAAVAEVGKRAFANCTKLKTAVFPVDGDLRVLGETAFGWCLALREAVLSERLERIGNGCFYRCHALEKADFPSNLKFIGNDAFFRCESLRPKPFPSALQYVGSDAFSGCVCFEHVVLPPSLRAAGTAVFGGCIRIKSFSVTLTGDTENRFCCSDFFDAAGGKNALPSGLEKVVVVSDKPLSVGGFCGAARLKTVVLPDSTVTIEDGCFDGCSRLSAFRVPPSLEKIGKRAFAGCDSLENLELPPKLGVLDTDSLPLLADGTPGGLLRLQRKGNALYLGNWLVGIADGRRYRPIGGPDVSVLEIAPHTVGIYSSACRGYDNLEKVVFPPSLRYVGDNAFRSCRKLSDATLPDSVEYVGENAFSGCSALNVFALPSSLKTLGKQSFCDCSSLFVGGIPSGITDLPDGAFKNCTRLASFDFGRVGSIGIGVFDGCSSLTRCVLHKEVKTVCVHAFRGCSSLEYVTLSPDTVFQAEDVGSGAARYDVFDGCLRVVFLNLLPGKITSQTVSLVKHVIKNTYAKDFRIVAEEEQCEKLRKADNGLNKYLTPLSGVDAILEDVSAVGSLPIIDGDGDGGAQSDG